MRALKTLLKKLQQFRKDNPNSGELLSMTFFIKMLEETVTEEQAIGKMRVINKERLKNLGRVTVIAMTLAFGSCTKENVSAVSLVEQQLLGTWKPISGTVEYNGTISPTYPPTLYWTASNFPYKIEGDSLKGNPSYHFVVTSTTLNLDRAQEGRKYHLYYQR